MDKTIISLLIVVFAVVFTPLVSKDIPCEVVLNTTNGFRIDVQYDSNGKAYHSLSDKNAKEWLINITFDGQMIKISNFSNPTTNYSRAKIYAKFGVYCNDLSNNCSDEINCHMDKYNQTSSKHHMECWLNNGQLNSNHSGFDFSFGQFKNPIVFKPKPSKNDLINRRFVAINRENRTNKFNISFTRAGAYIHVYITRFSDHGQIAFIRDMDESMFKGIDSIVAYNISQTFGWIIWFFIDGRNYYCTQPEDQSLSQQCNSMDKLEPLFSNCFPSEDLNFLWILIALIVVLALIVIALLGTVFYLKSKKPTETGSPVRPVETSPLERFRRNVQRKYKDESSVIGSNTGSTTSDTTDSKTLAKPLPQRGPSPRNSNKRQKK